MTQFIKYQEKDYRGGDRLNSVINKDIGSYLKNNELNSDDKERFIQIEAMKSDFRNQNRCPCHYINKYNNNSINNSNDDDSDNNHNDDSINNANDESDDDSNDNTNEKYKKSITPSCSENKNNKKCKYFIRENFDESLMNECECDSNEKNNNTVLIIFIVLFIIILGLIILLKVTKSSSIIELIKKIKCHSQ